MELGTDQVRRCAPQDHRLDQRAGGLPVQRRDLYATRLRQGSGTQATWAPGCDRTPGPRRQGLAQGRQVSLAQHSHSRTLNRKDKRRFFCTQWRSSSCAHGDDSRFETRRQPRLHHPSPLVGSSTKRFPQILTVHHFFHQIEWYIKVVIAGFIPNS